MTATTLYDGLALAADSAGGLKIVTPVATDPNDELGLAGYFEAHINGTQAGHVYAGGFWINVDAGFVDLAGGYFICAQDNGIYEAAATTFTNAIYVFGMRAEFISTSTPSGGFHVFSLNTSNRKLTSIFILADGGNSIGYTAGTGTSGTQSGYVPLYKTSSGSLRYVRVYETAT
jgi:hypothetical protein